MHRVLVAVLMAGGLLIAETDYRFAFPQSELLMGVDVKWLLKSPLGTKMRAEMGGEVREGLGELKALEALVDQIDHIYVSAVTKAPVKIGKGASPKAAGQAAANNTDLVMLVKGKFDFAKLNELALKGGMQASEWGKTKVFVPAAKPTGRVKMQKAQFAQSLPQTLPMDVSQAKPVFAYYDEKHILVGEEAPLRVALERMETGLVPQANPLFARAQDLEAAHDFWIVGSTAPLNLSAAAPAGAKQNDPFSQAMKEVRNFSVGIAVRRNLAFDLQLQTTTPKSATNMLDMARGVLALAKASQKPEQPLPFDLDRALELSSNGNILRASLTLEPGEVDAIVAQMGKKAIPGVPGSAVAAASPNAEGGTPVAQSAPAAAAIPVAPAVPQRKTVMIYGLPGGPKEVTVQP